MLKCLVAPIVNVSVAYLGFTAEVTFDPCTSVA